MKDETKKFIDELTDLIGKYIDKVPCSEMISALEIIKFQLLVRGHPSLSQLDELFYELKKFEKNSKEKKDIKYIG